MTARPNNNRIKWKGAGPWNLYFLSVCTLHAFDYISLDPLANMLLLIWVTLPVSNVVLKVLRQLTAFCAGFSLLWAESWLPGPDVLLENLQNLTQFTPAYLAELVAGFVNPTMVMALLVALGVWLALRDWIRFTSLSVAGLLIVAFPGMLSPFFTPRPCASTAPMAASVTVQSGLSANPAGGAGPLPMQTEPADEAHLTAWLQAFFESEAKRRTHFKTTASESGNFDIAVINICSLSKDDLEASGLNTHPVFSKFDVIFEAFNSATAYSGPATLRLVTGACGQPSHSTLYNGRRPDCEWMTALEKGGWESHLVLDHNGAFDHYLENLRLIGGVSAPLMDQKNLSAQYEAFDGTPIMRTSEVLNAWMKIRDASSVPTVSLMNLIALHDGNRLPGTSSSLPFKPRARKMLDDLDAFLDKLDAKAKPLMLIVVPEHGAAVRGDKIQVARLREIPSPAITQVPVYVKFVGLDNTGASRTIAGPTSYLALSELMARTIESGIYLNPKASHEEALNQIVRNLPLTWQVSENSNAVVMPYAGDTWLKLKNNRWLKYRK